MNTIPLCFVVLWFALGFWALICNGRTASQRARVLKALGDDFFDPRWDAVMSEYRAVSYERHMWALFTLRDPMKLYGPTARTVLEGAA